MAHGLVRFHRVVEDDLRAVLGLDEGVGIGDAPLEVTPLVVLHVRDERLAPDRLVGIEQRLEHLPLDAELLQRGLRLAEGFRRDRRDGLADVAGLVRERIDLARTDDRAHAAPRAGRVQVDTRYTRARVGAAQHGRVQHARQLEIGGVRRLATGFFHAVDTWDRLAHRREWPGRPLIERVLLDDDPDVLVAALDFLLGADQSRQVLIASSILG